MDDELDFDQLLSRYQQTRSQLAGMLAFVREASRLDWEAEVTARGPRFPLFVSLLRQLTQWDRCRVGAPPDPRDMAFSQYKTVRKKWEALSRAADQFDGYFFLNAPGTGEVWEYEDNESSVASVWSPRRSRNSFVLLAYSRVEPEAGAEERVKDAERVRDGLLLASMVFAGGVALANRPIYFSQAFRERFDDYEKLESQVKDLPATSEQDAKGLRLCEDLRDLREGNEKAYEFENLVRDAFAWLFSPCLGKPLEQEALFGGAKRIDLVFQNRATKGFWYDLPAKHLIPCPYVFVECKNYSADIGNPEVDQLLGRFASGRGKVGFLICNQIHDRMTLLYRCREAARDGRGWILALDKEDLIALLHAGLLDNVPQPKESRRVWDLLDDHFRMLTF